MPPTCNGGAILSKIDVKISGSTIAVFRERPVSKAEKKSDPTAKVMAEVVNITFGDGEPVIVVNRNLCS
jgi:hypothetical protein